MKAFDDQFGNIPWVDVDRARKLITEEPPEKVSEDMAYQNARRDAARHNARIEHGCVLTRVIASLMQDDTELCKQSMDNPSFKRWLSDRVFSAIYEDRPTVPGGGA